MAEEKKSARGKKAGNQQPSSLEGAEPEVTGQGSDLQPVSEADAPMHARLRADHKHWHGFAFSILRQDSVLSSQDYDLEKLAAAGAQLDLIDLESGDVIADLNDL